VDESILSLINDAARSFAEDAGTAYTRATASWSVQSKARIPRYRHRHPREHPRRHARDFLKLFPRQAERRADILATILARMSARTSLSMSASWNAAISQRVSDGKHCGWDIRAVDGEHAGGTHRGIGRAQIATYCRQIVYADDRRA